MRILLLGSHMHYNLEHYAYMNLVKLGHEVKFYGYKKRLGRLANLIRMVITRSKLMRDAANLLWLNKVNDEIKKVAEVFCPDLVLSIKGEAVKTETIEWIREELGARTAFWYPDDPRFFGSLVRYIAPSYDYVFTVSERAIEMYKRAGVERVHYLPLACEPTVHRKLELSREDKERYRSNVTFVGTYTPQRARVIRTLEKAGTKVRIYGPYWRWLYGSNARSAVYGHEMVKVLNASKVILNIHANVGYGPNMRCFEVTGSGAFLLTDNAGNIAKLFEIGKDLVVYNNINELMELVKYYLENEEERNEIAESGYNRCRSQHTYFRRLEYMVKLI